MTIISLTGYRDNGVADGADGGGDGKPWMVSELRA